MFGALEKSEGQLSKDLILWWPFGVMDLFYVMNSKGLLVGIGLGVEIWGPNLGKRLKWVYLNEASFLGLTLCSSFMASILENSPSREVLRPFIIYDDDLF